MRAHRSGHHGWTIFGMILMVHVILGFLLAMPVEALRLKTDWAQRVDLSQEIVRGEVIDTQSYWNAERTLIYTDVTIRVDEPIKGNSLTEMIITIPGGTVGEDTHWVSDTPQLYVGDYGVIFLESSGQVTGGPDGVYFLRKPAMEESGLLSSAEDQFLSWVKAYVRGETRASFEELPETESETAWQQSIEYTAIYGVYPSTTSAGTGVVLTVYGSGFGASRGSGSYPTIAFRYKDNRYVYNNSRIVSWSDSQIQVELFTGIVNNYDHSPGSWNDAVAFINGSGSFVSYYPLAVTFGYGRMKWMSSQVSYYTNMGGGPGGSLSAIQTAANSWSGAGANFFLGYAGQTTRGAAYDGYNVISFANLGSSSIIAHAVTYSSGGRVLESDIQFNTQFPFSTSPTPPSYQMDLETIALHELGHWLRLLDLYGENDTTKVMYGFCSNGQMKRSLTFDDQSGILWIYGTPPPSVTSFAINYGGLSTATRLVTLNNTATYNPTHYMASEDPGFAGATWQVYSTAPAFLLSVGSGKKRVYFKARNSSGESAVVFDAILALAPEVTSFKINAGAAKTGNDKVTLNNTATNNPTRYMASESPDFAGADWQTYSTAPTFTLSPGLGTKTVYFKVKNGFDESIVKNDEISAVVPEATLAINNGASSTKKGSVTLNNVARYKPTHYMASEDSGFAGAIWLQYSTAPSFALSSGAGTKMVYFKMKNFFGESTATNDTIEALAPTLTSFSINAGAASTPKGAVRLNNTATNKPTHYLASEDPGFAGASWQPYSTAPKFPLSDGAGDKTVYFKVKNSFEESGAQSDTITANGLAPAVTSLKINAGAASTGKEWVTLNNTATNFPAYYMASEFSDFSGAAWQAYSTAPNFALSAGAGDKRVYFKVKNPFGESEVMTKSISALGPEVTSFEINAGSTNTAKGLVTLNNSATKSPTHYLASEDPGFAGASWQPYSTAPKFTLTDGAGDKRVYFKVKNSFEESSVQSDTISADGLAPVVTSFRINAGAASAAKGVVTLDNGAANKPAHYMASEDPGFAGASWQPYSTAPKFSLSDGAGDKTVYFKVKNSFGESGAQSDTISADGLAPVVTSFTISAGAGNTMDGLVTLNNTGTNGPMYYMASESPGFVGASWQAYSTVPKFTLSDGAGTKTVYFKTGNIFGESSVVSDTIFLY